MQDFDFDVVSRNMGGATIPGDSLRVVYGSESARTVGGRNIAGIMDPCIDALIEVIGRADSLAEVTVAARALDRVLRAGRYWIPMWWNPAEFVAHWDMYDRPATTPKYSSGAPGTWWYNPDKARRIGRA